MAVPTPGRPGRDGPDRRDNTALVSRLHRAVVDGGAAADHRTLRNLARDEAPLLSDATTDEVVGAVLARVQGLGAIEPLLADPDVTDVLVNGPGEVLVERRGRVEGTGVRLDEHTVHHLVERIVSPLGLRVDRRNPLVDGRLADGSRVHVAMPPVAVDGPYVTIRRFGARTLPLTDFADHDTADLLVRAVEERRSILVIGGTGAGKTTLLNALCQHLDRAERVVTVEDAAELRLPGDHVVRLEGRPASPDGVGAVSIRELVRNALRMRPDRIVVGEVRGAEALDMVQAMHTGHDGSLSTCHANSPSDALARLETMMLTAETTLPLAAARSQLVSAIDVVIQVRRGDSSRRQVAAVHEVDADPEASPRTHPVDPARTDPWQRPARRAR